MEENIEISQNRLDFTEFSAKIEAVRSEISKYILGQSKMIDLLLIAVLAEGHVLIEGVPGIAKTLSARILSKTIDTEFKRIQFTPDLLPSDIIGTSVFHLQKSEFNFKKGPIFTNILLADEINRAPAKTQAALFEAMEEQEITVDGNTYILEDPFIVLATQNPVDLEGTYRLPEAQIDRFIFKINVNYPETLHEIEILKSHFNRKGKVDIESVAKVISTTELKNLRKITKQVHVEDKLYQYIANIVAATRNNSDIYLGASPRASISIMTSSQAFAAMNGRDYIIPDDVRFVAPYVLNHRLILSPEKEIEGIDTNEFIKDLLQTVEIPR